MDGKDISTPSHTLLPFALPSSVSKRPFGVREAGSQVLYTGQEQMADIVLLRRTPIFRLFGR